MTNKQVAECWITQSKWSSITIGNDKIFTRGGTIYSYGLHFPIASIDNIDGKSIVYLNISKTTNSTIKHRQLVRNVIPNDYKIIEVTYNELIELLNI